MVNGDEQQRATLERLEAKLDRLGERVMGHDARFDDVQARFDALEDRLLKEAHVGKLRHDELMGRTAQLDAKVELIRIDLGDLAREESRMAASHAETTVRMEVDQLRGELDALAQRVEQLARRVGTG